MTNDHIARPEDIQIDQDEIVALSFLATHRMPTRGNYQINLRQWFQWCEDRGIRPLTASRAHVEVYQRELEEVRKLKLSTIANKVGTLGGFYTFAFLEGHTDTNIGEFVKRPKVSRVSTTEAPTRVELQKMLAIAEGSGRVSELLLIGLLGLHGLRVGEAVAIDFEDISRNGAYLTIRIRRQKGNKDGLIPLPLKLIWPIQRLMKAGATGPLLRMRTGERMDRKAAGRIVRRIAKEAGITKRITPHSLRHAFITLAHDAGVHARDIQHSLGYADLRMVSYYDRGGEDLAKNAANSVAAYVDAG